MHFLVVRPQDCTIQTYFHSQQILSIALDVINMQFINHVNKWLKIKKKNTLINTIYIFDLDQEMQIL